MGKKKASKSAKAKAPVIVYSDHAKDRMKQRRITEAQVESVIQNPTNVGTGNTEHTEKYSRTFPQGKLLAVIVSNGGFCIKVITVYWE